MGDFQRKKQAENFKKAREKAMLDARQQSLFQRDLKTSVAFTICPVGDCTLSANESLVLVATENGVTVLRGNKCVGTVPGESAEIAKKTMTELGSPHALKVMVTTVSDMSGTAQAQMTI